MTEPNRDLPPCPDTVRESTFDEHALPLVVEPAASPLDHALDPVAWAAENRDYLASRIHRHGAVLLRGFPIADPPHFEATVRAASSDPLPYRERSSPRSQVSGNVYTSTDHPADQTIHLHNEQSYNLTFPLMICFFCVTPAAEGGATPLADCRRVYRRIDPEVRRRLEARDYLYVRNFWGMFGLPWEVAFQTSERAEVEAYCAANDIGFEWVGDRLRTKQRRPVSALHPHSGEPSWFNHLTFFHLSTLPAAVRDMMLSSFPTADLPNNTYYGDGEPIEPEVLDHLRGLYGEETVSFPWRQGDALLVDNLSVAHGRQPFSGERKVVVAMAEPTAWAETARPEPVAEVAR
jgi:alpha-ketoglutarate-dependent taurine dioxygenase